MRFIASAITLLAAQGLFAADVDPTYLSLRAARPSGPGLSVRGVVLERDAFRFTFESGTFFFLPKVAGRCVGAVFVGTGEWRLTPRTAFERRHLAVVLDDHDLKTVSDRFEKIVLLFTDGTEEELRRAEASPASGPPSSPDGAWDRFLKAERRELHVNLHLRLLPDLLEDVPAAGGAFFAYVEGKKVPPALIQLDPRGVPFSGAPAEEAALFVFDELRGGAWYLSRKAGAGPAAGSPARAEHYRIDTKIRKNTDLEGTTDVRFRVSRAGIRVLELALFPKLRLKEASFAPGGTPEAAAFRPLRIVQEDARDDAQAAVVFPEPLEAGAVVTLRLSYAGEDVLQDAGGGNYVVGARQSWYPNLGSFMDPTAFDLTYRIPKKNDIISVGRRVSKEVDGDFAVSRFTTDEPLRVAGFNYGRFNTLERKDDETGVTVRVFTNPGKPSFARELEMIDEIARFDTDRLAQSALADGINTMRTGNVFFGPLPGRELAITQQAQWNFGQSWPSLVYLPYLAFLTSTTRMSLGIFGMGDFIDQVGPHEVAHQWFGHHVGWATYRDEWLSEGFAEFASALVLQQTSGYGRYFELLDKAKKHIFSAGRGEKIAFADVGPIALGRRLSDGRHAGAYAAVVYEKGAWVLHMLRVLMRERGTNPDGRFIGMMHDWVTTYAGKNPSTEDFQHTVERHMTPGMDVRHDGSMAWFFDQWVRGVEIPRLVCRVDVKDAGEGRYALTGEISQSGVSEGFRTPVSLYAEFEKGEIARIGGMLLTGTATLPVSAEVRLPKKPRRVVLNAFRDVLSRD